MLITDVLLFNYVAVKLLFLQSHMISLVVFHHLQGLYDYHLVYETV